jgi:Cu(I)/Ag(I) efflux system membrane protein CusA/SilA
MRAVNHAVAAGTIKMPGGYNIFWSGQYEYMLRARERLLIVIPLTLLIIVLIIYLNTRSLIKTAIVMLAVPFSLVGAFAVVHWLGYNLSVAVWVGFIACFGMATETGIIMLVYLREAIEKRGGLEKIKSLEELRQAVIEGAVHRLRPKLLTEGVAILAIFPE